ncbi:serine/threonine-protein kinase [Nocardiopsis mangrovi]|uniref:Serine/threonine-protein kinase n=1 Tax=Nocardiopsis mangrovi TaxID=1179818 RepID=A0ABV9DV82_9ACTN
MPSDGLPKNLEPLAAGDPATIGPYVVAGRLGSGGMGTVYLGRTPEKDSQVAIKVIRPELAFDEATRARFHDEMENARRVASFCTAKVLDHGTFENRPYMVTEYIAGTALAEHIAEQGPLDSSTLHGFALGVAAALAAIHRAGLVHRDLKPANVLLSLSGPRVIDFGIARAMNTMTNHTQTGIVMGSPGWMAPEQLLEEKVTTAADIFAWGCLVAFAGNGAHPFGNGDAMTLGKRVLFAEPQLGDLDSPLDRLVAKALAKEPDRRPKAQDLLLELAGGEDSSSAGSDIVSARLTQTWRPNNLPPMPPMPPMPGPPHNPHQAMQGVGRPGPPPQGPHGPPPHPYPAPQHAPMPANMSQPMQRPGGVAQRPVHQTGQFPVVSPQQTGPIPQVPGPQDIPPSATRPHSQPYVPPVPPPPHRPVQPAKRRMRWVAITAVIAAVLVLLLFTVLTLLGLNQLNWPGWAGAAPDDTAGAGQQEEPGDGSDPSAAPSAGESDGAAAPNSASDGRLEFNVREYECTLDVEGRSRPTGGTGTYCIFAVSVRNTTGDSIEVQADWQRLRGSGQVYFAQTPLGGEASESLWRPIEGGEMAEGTLTFLVVDSEDADSGELMLTSREQGDPAMIQVSDVDKTS